MVIKEIHASWDWIFKNPILRKLGVLKIQASGGLFFRKSKPPEAWIFKNPSIRKLGFLENPSLWSLGFSKIRASGVLIFRKFEPPEVWISENPSLRRLAFSKIQASGGSDFWNSELPEDRIFRESDPWRHEFHEISLKTHQFKSPGRFQTNPSKTCP